MNKRNNQIMMPEASDKRLLDVNEVCYYLSLGKNRGVEFARSIGAEVKVGRRSLFDREKLDEYLNELTGA